MDWFTVYCIVSVVFAIVCMRWEYANYPDKDNALFTGLLVLTLWPICLLVWIVTEGVFVGLRRR